MYICVDGLAGAGKTTLIEQLLKSNRSRCLTTARLVVTDSVKEITEVPGGNDETARFEAGGVLEAALYHIPRDVDWNEASVFRRIAVIDGIISEGALAPYSRPDLTVYVIRPRPDTNPVVMWEDRVVDYLPFDEYVRIISGDRYEPDPFADKPEDSALPDAGDPDADDIEEEIIEVPDEQVQQLLQYIQEGIPIHKKGWFLNDSYTGLERARVVVFNIHSEDERSLAEKQAEELRAAYTNEKIRMEVFKSYGGHDRMSIFIANLADSRDTELKKTIARIKRVFTRRY